MILVPFLQNMLAVPAEQELLHLPCHFFLGGQCEGNSGLGQDMTSAADCWLFFLLLLMWYASAWCISLHFILMSLSSLVIIILIYKSVWKRLLKWFAWACFDVAGPPPAPHPTFHGFVDIFYGKLYSLQNILTHRQAKGRLTLERFTTSLKLSSFEEAMFQRSLGIAFLMSLPSKSLEVVVKARYKHLGSTCRGNVQSGLLISCLCIILGRIIFHKWVAVLQMCYTLIFSSFLFKKR